MRLIDRGSRRGLRAVCSMGAMLLLAWVLPLASRAAQGRQLEERAFTIVHRSVDEAYAAVTALIGPEGEVSLSKSSRRLSVRDEPARLNEIAAALARFDVPLHRVRFTLKLLRGETAPPGPKVVMANVPPNLRDQTRYNTWQELGHGEAVVREGGREMIMVGSDFRVSIELGAVNELTASVALKKVALERARPGQGGERQFRESVAVYKDTIKPNVVRIMGLAAGTNAPRALFLVVVADILPEPEG